jgi:hypothetical protein
MMAGAPGSLVGKCSFADPERPPIMDRTLCRQPLPTVDHTSP